MMRLGWVACLLGGYLASIAPAAAQMSTGGSVRGHVKDEQDAVLQGVRLTATSADTPTTYTASTDETGYYRLLDLPPGEYTLAAELEGFARWVREGVVVRAGLNITVPVVMRLSTVTETVTVTLETPLLESERPGQGVNISGEMQRAVPLSARRLWTDALQLTPGVFDASGTGFYHVHGASINSHVFLIDGADVASARENNSSYMNLNTDAIADVQVKTSGVDASAQLGLGAVVNVSTTSGTDRFRGNLGITRQPRSWNSSNDPRGTSAKLDVLQPDLAVGGPLRRGRAWFFTSLRYMRWKRDVSRGAEQIARLTALSPTFTPFSSQQEGPAFLFKGTAQLRNRHQLSAMYSFDRTSQGTPVANFAEDFTRNVIGGPVYTLRVNSTWASSLLSRVLVSYNEKGLKTESDPDAPGRIVHQSAFLSSGRLVGTGALATLQNNTIPDLDEPASKATISADVTHYRPRGWGSHEIQMGFFWQPILRQEQTGRFRAGGVLFEELIPTNAADLSSALVPFHQRIFESELALLRSLDTSDLAGYLQDAWKPHARLTLSLGLRVDRVRRLDKLFDVVTQNSVEIGPRIGVNYALTDDSRHAVKGSFGRIHENPSTGRVDAGSTSLGFRDVYDLDLNGSFETVFVTPGRSGVASDRVIDSSYHQPFTQEWTTGYESQWPGRIRVDFDVTRREYRDMTTGVETNGIYTGGRFGGYLNEAFNQIWRITNNEWNRPVYTGVSVNASKQTERWRIIAGWARQWRHLEGTWQPNDTAFFLQPHAFANDRGIGDIRGALTYDSYVNNTFGGVMWRDHVVQAGAVFQAPWGIQLAGHYLFLSGQWSGPIFTQIAAPDPTVGPPMLQLSNGRLVSNPLATRIRFAYDDRGDGQLTTPDVHRVNVRMAYERRVWGQRVTLALDAFNVTNHGADYAFTFGPAQQLFSPLYGTTTTRQSPRAFQISAGLAF